MFVCSCICSPEVLSDGQARKTICRRKPCKGRSSYYDSYKVAQDQASACAFIEPLKVTPEHYDMSVAEAGMLPDDLEALRQVIDRLNVIVTFRDTNPACAPHLVEGMESKGHEVMTKTFMKNNLPPKFEYLAGTVSTLPEKPKPGKVIPDPLSLRYLTPDGHQLTCDYDLMDMLEADGDRIPGESAADLELREELNDALPLRGEKPQEVDRIKHGAQAAKGHPETPVLILDKPEAPLTVMDAEKNLLRLETIEDVLNFYHCVGATILPEWHLMPNNE